MTIRFDECKTSFGNPLSETGSTKCCIETAEVTVATLEDATRSVSAFRAANRPRGIVAQRLRELCNRSTTFTQPSCKRAIY